MDNTTSKPEAALPGLIRKVLGSPHSEQAIKAQIIQLAGENLHILEVTTALLEVLPLTKDKETKDRLVRFLSGLDTSRFTDLPALFDALLTVFREEKDREVRTVLLTRLKDSLHQDGRLVSFFMELSTKDGLSEPERAAIQDALATLPAITEEVALAALDQNKNAPARLQEQALSMAERYPVWGSNMAAALQPYLDVKNERSIRWRILDRLAEAKQLDAQYTPLLITILRTDNDNGSRLRALKVLSLIRPWNEEVMVLLLWSGTQDGDPGVRQEALRLQNEVPELSNEQLEKMARLLMADRSLGVRLTILSLLKPVMRIPQIRLALAETFAANAKGLDDQEFDSLTGMLVPYAGRDEQIAQLLLNGISWLAAGQRRKLFDLLLPVINIDTLLPTLVRFFTNDRDEGIRERLFTQLKALSVTRHPELVDIYCTELMEPGSPYRITCAGIVANAAESYSQIPPALEDVLKHDRDRQLVALCLDGYLRPGVIKQFAPLLAVVRNEVLDQLSRQKALDAIVKLPVTPEEQETLAAVLSGLKPGTLKIT
jgi:hypothetical protein